MKVFEKLTESPESLASFIGTLTSNSHTDIKWFERKGWNQLQWLNFLKMEIEEFEKLKKEFK